MCNNPTLLPTSACPTSFSSPDSGIATLGNVRGMVSYTTAHTQKCDMHVTIVLLYRCNAIKHSDVILKCDLTMTCCSLCRLEWRWPRQYCTQTSSSHAWEMTQPHRHKVAVNILNTELVSRKRLDQTGLSWNCYANSLLVPKIVNPWETNHFWKILEVKKSTFQVSMCYTRYMF